MTCDAANVADKRAGVPASFWNERVESAAIVAAVAVVSAILFFVDPADSSVYPISGKRYGWPGFSKDICKIDLPSGSSTR